MPLTISVKHNKPALFPFKCRSWTEKNAFDEEFDPDIYLCPGIDR